MRIRSATCQGTLVVVRLPRVVPLTVQDEPDILDAQPRPRRSRSTNHS
jgi:hypothetical protein